MSKDTESGNNRKQQKEVDFVGAIGIWEMQNIFGNTIWGQLVKSPDCQAQDADSQVVELLVIKANEELG